MDVQAQQIVQVGGHLKEADAKISDDMLEQILGFSPIKFIFVVDRSGSMSGKPMAVTKNALNLFLSSLPEGCEVEIISFGSYHEYESIDGQTTFTYNSENKRLLQSSVD